MNRLDGWLSLAFAASAQQVRRPPLSIGRDH
jgi:hypothetical protein